VPARSNSLLFAAAALTAVVGAISSPSASAVVGSPAWSGAVNGICAHALLFEGRHEIGTRAGAIAVARDIRASTGRRLRRIQALPMASPRPVVSSRWLGLERRLADVYASSYVRIFDAIAAAYAHGRRAELPRVLDRLLHAPDPLRATTASLEHRLGVPDCTGGTPNAAPGAVTP
jgi:hypothetical protein